MLSCVLAASCTCNDANLCKSSGILFPASWKRHKFCKMFNAFLTSIELASQQGASYFSLTSLFEDFFQGLSEADISRLNFLNEFSLNWGHVVLTTLKKKERKNFRTKFCQFNAIINIWMPEMNSTIHSKPLSGCLR